MNSEHYRLEALKLAVEVLKEFKENMAVPTTDLAEKYYQFIIQDQVKAEQAQKEAEKQQYKIPPNQRNPKFDY